ncbi:hypothetical protein E2C01_098253 [Portunus trituberculatus]|uniref:Uncharacterized protein n=1 Tax=Portunus trituberculatus TaxID=210409 RepID=A0A5B7K7X7_PORTR|nr:hypothetical protein [Portunus trituberculatus]
MASQCKTLDLTTTPACRAADPQPGRSVAESTLSHIQHLPGPRRHRASGDLARTGCTAFLTDETSFTRPGSPVRVTHVFSNFMSFMHFFVERPA